MKSSISKPTLFLPKDGEMPLGRLPSSSFIRESGMISLNRWQNLAISYCEFDQAQFSQSLFSELHIKFPEKLNQSVTKRKAEYLAGRCSVQQAFQAAGLAWEPPGIGRHGEPCWPAGINGSISHSKALAVAVVSKREDYPFLGIDVEELISQNVAKQIQSEVLLPDELHLSKSIKLDETEFLTWVFSAKETLFKAIHKYVGKYFGYECAQVIDFKFESGKILLELTVNLAPGLHKGRRFTCITSKLSDHFLTLIASSG